MLVDESSNILKKANLVSMSKTTTENDRNVSTKIAAATFKNEIGSEKVSGEGVETVWIFRFTKV